MRGVKNIYFFIKRFIFFLEDIGLKKKENIYREMWKWRNEFGWGYVE